MDNFEAAVGGFLGELGRERAFPNLSSAAIERASETRRRFVRELGKRGFVKGTGAPEGPRSQPVAERRPATPLVEGDYELRRTLDVGRSLLAVELLHHADTTALGGVPDKEPVVAARVHALHLPGDAPLHPRRC